MDASTPTTRQFRPLMPEAFAPFGQVLQPGPPPSGEAGQAVNSGISRRHALVGNLPLGLSRALVRCV